MKKRNAWISPQLARQRTARVSALRYDFELAIDATARILAGVQRIALTLGTRRLGEDLFLDWRPHDLQRARAGLARSLRINGGKPPRDAFRLSAGHLVIAASALRPGPNEIELAWTAAIRDAGSALTRVRDPADGSLYVYTLFVPADASSIFPCFDQPDLKARFALTLDVRRSWEVIANAPLVARTQHAGESRFQFAPTEPISTYLFAFAAGAFVVAGSDASGARVWVRRSQRRHAGPDAEAAAALQARAIRGCTRFFGHRFPFAKRDLVLLPQFPYRGMEHPGAVFLAERDVLLGSGCSDLARFERMQLIFHEIAHQWMGNLVTMRSFSDLWLKEGFANFMAYRLAARARRRATAGVAFHALKVQAYRTDQTPGATALHDRLRDAADAASAYGTIVYAKAPALLRQLQHALGAEIFRRGVQTLVHRHAYGAIDWRDFVTAMESAAGRSLQTWAARWILRPGVPRLDWRIRSGRDGGALVWIGQRAGSAAARAPWPLQFTTQVVWADGGTSRQAVELRGARAKFALNRTVEKIRQFRLDADDNAYFLAAANPDSVAAAEALLTGPSSPLGRMQAWETLWQAVFDGPLAPSRFVTLASTGLRGERNPLILQNVLQHAQVALDRLLDLPQADALGAALETLLLARERRAREPLRLLWQAQLVALARTARALDAVAAILHGSATPTPRRLRAAVALVLRGAYTQAQARRAVAPSAHAAHLAALQIEAASARPERKQKVFAHILRDSSLPDETLLATAAVLFHPAHAHATQTLLAPALRALPPLARRRKIFFVNRWIAAAVGGQNAAAALALLRRFTASDSIEPAVRRKCAEAAYELAQVVCVRRRSEPRA